MKPARPSILALAVAVVALAMASPADAKSKGKLVFEVYQVQLKVKAPTTVGTSVKAALAKSIKQNPRLLATLDSDAPDPKTEPKKFKAYLQRKQLRAFRVNVEVTAYSTEIEESARGKNLVVRVSLRLFGETVPDRSMAFTGDGSATIKLGVGSKVRERDHEIANRDAIELAVDDAVATSLKKLDAGTKKKR